MKGILKKLLSDKTLQHIKMTRDFIPYYYRFGKEFRSVYNELEKTQTLNEEQLKEYQLFQLKSLISHAYENVPYYRKVFDQRNLKPSDIKNINDIKKIPYLTKEIIHDNFEDLININIPKKYLKIQTTGGSSGNPLAFYEDARNAESRESAFVSHIWSRAGFDPKKVQRFVIIRGNKVKKGIMELDGLNLILSSYHLTEENIDIYLKRIEEYNPDFIQAYPSSLEIISKYILVNEKYINSPKLKAIFCSSEMLLSHQRSLAERAFNTRILDLYGHSEHCCIAGECEMSNYKHFQSEYGLTELINENNKEVIEENEAGEIIATNFNNYAMPFIRYKTGDIGILTNRRCDCGRSYPIIKDIQGRESEQIITKSGAKVAMTAIIFAQHFEAFKKVKRMQLLQEEVGKVIVRIIENELLNSIDKEEIKTKMKDATSNEIDVVIEIVKEISLTKRGKHKFLIQKLKF